jgi:hypothetical protein
MLPRYQPRLVTIVIAFSVTLEMALLASVYTVSDGVYHGIHLALMAILIGSQLALYVRHKGLETSRYAKWLAIGLGATAVGDFVNSGVSGVEPVTTKLSWALLFFGVGYTLYCAALWHYGRSRVREGAGGYRTLKIAIPIVAVVNIAGWLGEVEPNLGDHAFLWGGSLAFSLTIYALLPALAIWFYRQSGYSTTGLLIVVAAILIPYSDVVLFSSWLADGNPAVPPRELYAFNWVLYFSGQALMSLFPASAMQAEVELDAALAA